MSQLEALEPTCPKNHSSGIKIKVESAPHDLGGFSVRRVLPAPEVRSVGPFVFFDEMGPAEFPPGQGINVRPHPHIGLSTVTFLFDGEIMHKDSIGFEQAIQPGAVNLMTAGKGIVHSERTSEERMANGQKLHGLQVWMALPTDQQEIDPAFVHYPAEQIPVVERDNIKTTVVIGAYGGQESAVEVLPDTLYLVQELPAGTEQSLSFSQEEIGVYVVSGTIEVNGCGLQPGSMAVVDPNQIEISNGEAATIVIVGGEHLGNRYKFWNFIHSDRSRIDQAKQDWAEGRFDMIEGDDEFIPLPEPVKV